jgi:GNAT superfamily N-acetyltransferase
MAEGPPQVRRLGVGDWRVARDVRLAMLADAPHAFATTLAQARAAEQDVWQDRVRRATTFCAFAGERPVGSVTLRAHPRQPATAEATAMWVAGDVRGRGIGGLLLDAALDHWRALAGRHLVLWVYDTNPAARALYSRKGFEPTGRTQRDGAGRLETELGRAID